MKLLSYLSIAILSSTLSWGQELQIVDSKLAINSAVGTSTSTVIKVKNTSNHIMIIGIEKVEENIRSSQVATFCLNNDCSETNIVEHHSIIKLFPGEIYSGFSTSLETGLVPGNSSVKFLIYNVANTSESIEAEITYSIKDKDKEGVLFSSDAVKLSDVFPNPVREQAIFKYAYLNPDKEAKIIIHNVLGSVIGEFSLSPYESRLIIPVDGYNPGVYFYTLYIDNKAVATKKMVVRK